MWRVATESDDQTIVSMCLELNSEDPGPTPVPPEQVQRTLSTLREQPHRGRAVVCIKDRRVVGYALLISFWSNELYVAPQYRRSGLATNLLQRLAEGGQSLWPAKPVALALEVAPQNHRAMALYRRLGFRGENVSVRRLLPQSPEASPSYSLISTQIGLASADFGPASPVASDSISANRS